MPPPDFHICLPDGASPKPRWSTACSLASDAHGWGSLLGFRCPSILWFWWHVTKKIIVPVCSYSCGKALSKSNLGRCLFYLRFSCHSLSLSDISVETQAGIWRQSLKQRPWRNTVYWLAPLWLAQTSFIYYPGPPTQGWHLPQWAGSSPINHSSRRCPTDLPTGQWSSFLIWGSFFLNDPDFWQMDNKIKETNNNNNNNKTKQTEQNQNQKPLPSFSGHSQEPSFCLDIRLTLLLLGRLVWRSVLVLFLQDWNLLKCLFAGLHLSLLFILFCQYLHYPFFIIPRLSSFLSSPLGFLLSLSVSFVHLATWNNFMFFLQIFFENLFILRNNCSLAHNLCISSPIINLSFNWLYLIKFCCDALSGWQFVIPFCSFILGFCLTLICSVYSLIFWGFFVMWHFTFLIFLWIQFCC